MSVSAVLLGFVLDVAITVLAPLGLEIVNLILGLDASETGLSTLYLILGLLATVFGGYVAGSKAGFKEAWHGAAVGALGLLLGVGLMSVLPRELTSALPLWFSALNLLVPVPLGALGGYIAWLLKPRNDVFEQHRHDQRDASWR